MDHGDDAALTERLRLVRSAITQACARSGRDPQSVTLVAVSKMQAPAALAAVLRLGQRDLGENYAQELRDKARLLATEDPRWHFIGTLQKNKIPLVVGTSSLIHTVDSEALIAAIAARARRAGICQDCLLEVNVGDEPQKGGCAPALLPVLLDAVCAAGGAIRCRGLMCIPPPVQDARPFFQRLRGLAEAARRQNRPHVELAELSMGMSQDFAVAIEEGATLVRVGTAIFGARKEPGKQL